MENEKLIYADSARVAMEYMKKHIVAGDSDFLKGYLNGIEGLANGLAELPAVDAVEVKHGRWEPRTDAIGFVRCSVCHDCNIYDDWADGKKWNYCPNCGAKMDGDENG